MFVSFLLPFADRGSGPLYRWVMLAQMARMGEDGVAFIGDERYFSEEGVPFGETLAVSGVVFQVPTRDAFRKFRKAVLDGDDPAMAGEPSLELFRSLLTDRHEALAREIRRATEELLAGETPEAFLTWANCPSLSAAAEAMGVPVIHNENGPLRPPSYANTVYFDFSGVNGSTTPSRWMSLGELEQEMEGAEVVPVDELRLLLGVRRERSEATSRDGSTGVALQVEDDSNIIAYSRGWDSLKLLYEANASAPDRSVLVRSHPSAHFRYQGGLGEVDTSATAEEFLSRVDSVLAINSSVLSEAFLKGIPFRALGDCPVAPFSIDAPLGGLAPREYALALNAFFLGYLVPERFLFDSQYYRWRLARPRTLAECHRCHLEYLRGATDDRHGDAAEDAWHAGVAGIAVSARAGDVPDWLANQAVGRKLTTLESRVVALTSELHARQEAVDWLEGQRVSLAEAVALRDEAIEELRQGLESRESAVRWLEEWRQSAQQELDARAGQLDTLREQLDERGKSVAWLEEWRASSESELAARESALQELRTHLESRERAVTWLESQRESLSQELEAQARVVDELRSHLETREEAVRWLEEWRQSAQQELDARAGQLDTLREQLDERGKAVAWLEEWRASSESELAARESALQELRTHLESRERAVTWLESQRESLSQELEAQARVVDELRSHLETREEAVGWLEGQRQSLSAEVEAQSRAVADLRDHLQTREEVIAWLEGQLHGLRAELARMTALRDKSAEEAAELSARNTCLEDETRQAAAEFEARADELRGLTLTLQARNAEQAQALEVAADEKGALMEKLRSLESRLAAYRGGTLLKMLERAGLARWPDEMEKG